MGDVPAGPVCLDRTGCRLPPFNSGDAIGKRAQESRRVVRTAVGSGLAEPVLVTTEAPVQLGPPLDLSQVSTRPGIAPLRGDEVCYVAFGSGPGLFGTRPLQGPEAGVGEQARDVGRCVIGDPLTEAGVLAVGGGEIVG